MTVLSKSFSFGSAWANISSKLDTLRLDLIRIDTEDQKAREDQKHEQEKLAEQHAEFRGEVRQRFERLNDNVSQLSAKLAAHDVLTQINAKRVEQIENRVNALASAKGLRAAEAEAG